MNDLKQLQEETRLLFTIPLKPLQGDRFQPTGFPNLGAATYQTAEGQKLLVESAQSMANRLEATCWDEAKNKPVGALDGISHVTVEREKAFLTDSMLEAHRINSPYLLEGKDKTFFETIKKDLGGLAEGPIDRAKLAQTLLKYDVGSLIHGVFLAKKDLAGGRLRVARALSAFIEASNTQVAASGGVKNDHVNPSGDTGKGFGNVPFSRDEFTAQAIDMHVNLDLAQIRGYGLGPDVERLLILLSLYKVRKLLNGDLRLRTACDLEPVDRSNITAKRPDGFALPALEKLENALKDAISKCKDMMEHKTVVFDDKLKKGKGETDTSTSADDEAAENETDED
jgi:CRISPR-associated protein Csb1